MWAKERETKTNRFKLQSERIELNAEWKTMKKKIMNSIAEKKNAKKNRAKLL